MFIDDGNSLNGTRLDTFIDSRKQLSNSLWYNSSTNKLTNINVSFSDQLVSDSNRAVQELNEKITCLSGCIFKLQLEAGKKESYDVVLYNRINYMLESLKSLIEKMDEIKEVIDGCVGIVEATKVSQELIKSDDDVNRKASSSNASSNISTGSLTISGTLPAYCDLSHIGFDDL